ncbi:MAG TPA: alpha/beta fold hydrolase [Baekduia sp.]|uniref:alpha/beta fold hydrolase n=1 Tax=Baekduia sp. TaxID=2600305 RepID=UPI002D788156|nr:alpha/beta fold hydrolase [Baekduia sp.]HET6507604.1 alpha/beta fold hydrolase [Baekduia sp.]
MLIDLDDIRMNVIDEGEGQVLLFLHGLGACHRIWEAQLDAFRDDFRCVAPDLRNSGRTDVVPGPVSVEQLADDVARLCERIGVDRAVVVGQSMGGMVAQALAVHHPRLVDVLVFVGSGVDGRHGPGPSKELAPVEDVARRDGIGALPALVRDGLYPASFQAAHPERIWHFERDLMAFDLEGLLALLHRRVETDYSTELRTVKVPTLILAGRHDQVLPPEESQYLQQLMPHAELLVWEECGHQPFVEDPARFEALLRAFVASIPAAA